MIEPYILCVLAKLSKPEDAEMLGRLVKFLSGRTVRFENRSEELFAMAIDYIEKQKEAKEVIQ